MAQWLEAWVEGCRDLERVLHLLRRRVEGPLPYFPMLREPGRGVDRERCLAFNRQWTAVIGPILDEFVDRAVCRRRAVPDPGSADGGARGGGAAEAGGVNLPRRRSRSRRRDEASSSSSSSSSSSRLSTRRAARRSGGGDTAGSVDVDVVGEAPVADGGSEVDNDAAALVQMMSVEEEATLQLRGVGAQCREALQGLLAHLRELQERRAGGGGADGVAWIVHALVHTMRRVVLALEGVCQFLGTRGETVRRLPPTLERQTLLSLCSEVVHTNSRMVADVMASGMETAWLDHNLQPPLVSMSTESTCGGSAGVRDRSRSRDRGGGVGCTMPPTSSGMSTLASTVTGSSTCLGG